MLAIRGGKFMENKKIMDIAKQVFCITALTGFLGICLTESSSSGGRIKITVFFLMLIASVIIRLILQNPKAVFKYSLMTVIVIILGLIKLISVICTATYNVFYYIDRGCRSMISKLDSAYHTAKKLKTS